ncbi:DinB family protein [Hyunsoonleella pacifica]|uniref:DinB family protein n=1 Tax=Hyunsoonleella pacifica TaxID=1080224 RepID=A0A4Q9FSJ3_9FLAO|nr:DinB family protein [Hyunsoonleella pacifica]TBN18973.1 DinB family protein [Hyunsoonleella pacifica]GGD06264.1 hypothetical protein GCM10011368_05160 [Hyunsoonleella pacifica]
MNKTISELELLLSDGLNYIANAPEIEFSKKLSSKKWSKKEILGHLIDSAINNLQRFTEIQFETEPYIIKQYSQDELVKANHYQSADTKELLDLWIALNNRILFVIKNQNEETLNYKVHTNNTTIVDLKFLIKDYVDHLSYHLNQIMN